MKVFDNQEKVLLRPKGASEMTKGIFNASQSGITMVPHHTLHLYLFST